MSSLERISRPWSIRGVTLEARTKAAKAAARRRMTLGEWVTNALIRTANDELGSGRREGEAAAGVPATTPRPGAEVVAGVTRLEPRPGDDGRDRALYAIARHVAETERRSERTMTLLAKIAETDGGEEALMALADQIDGHRREVDAKLDLIARAVHAIGEQMGGLHRRIDASLELEARTLAAVSATLRPLQQLAEPPAPRVQPAPEPEPAEVAPAAEAVEASQPQLPSPGTPRIDFAVLHSHAVENTNREAASEGPRGTGFFNRFFNRKDAQTAA
jgi:hypothetical protein